LPCSGDILISVRPEYFAKILNGNKTVELRRRPIRVSVGTNIWIYETIPGGRVAARAKISAICEGTPAEVWRRFRHRVGISEYEFEMYFQATQYACAVVLSGIEPLKKPLMLTHLRKSLGTFTAPQFYRKLRTNGPELALFQTFASGC
jgi:predicted transcriptional regulator